MRQESDSLLGTHPPSESQRRAARLVRTAARAPTWINEGHLKLGGNMRICCHVLREKYGESQTWCGQQREHRPMLDQGKAVERQWKVKERQWVAKDSGGKAVERQGKAVKRQWMVKERRWKGSGRTRKGGEKAVEGQGKTVGGQGQVVYVLSLFLLFLKEAQMRGEKIGAERRAAEG